METEVTVRWASNTLTRSWTFTCGLYISSWNYTNVGFVTWPLTIGAQDGAMSYRYTTWGSQKGRDKLELASFKLIPTLSSFVKVNALLVVIFLTTIDGHRRFHSLRPSITRDKMSRSRYVFDLGIKLKLVPLLSFMCLYLCKQVQLIFI